MAFLKPTVTKVREYDVAGNNAPSMNGMIANPPRFEKMGGLTGKSKVEKNKMAVTDRGNGKHGPYSKG